jgi:hypothetical protein
LLPVLYQSGSRNLRAISQEYQIMRSILARTQLRRALNSRASPPEKRPILMAGLALSALVAVGLGTAMAGGGTAKPGTGTIVPQLNVVIPPPPVVPQPAFTNLATTVGFDITGFIQSATVDTAGAICVAATPSQSGGTLTVNGVTIVVPCNTTLQFPAATYTFADLFTDQPSAITLDGTGSRAAVPPEQVLRFPSVEVSVVGNIVNGRYIAGLLKISQQSLNAGSGFVVSIEYDGNGASTGSLMIGPTPGGPATVRVQINDPTGKYTAGQSPDKRFSVDDQNPTITAASGYPMCIPRTNLANDPRCPAKNRPTTCRNFASAGVFSPAVWEISGVKNISGACNAFVMKAPIGNVPTAAVAAANIPALTAAQIIQPNDIDVATQPDAREQVPFTVGDYVNYSGTLMVGSSGGPNGSDTISAHTVQANVGAFTQPGSLPAYVWVEETIIGADAAPVAGLPLAPLEGQNRLVVVGRTTDVRTPVDLYFIDVDPATGVQTNRWVTMESMTGGLALLPGSQPFGGGITTQFTGPQPGRVRARGAKATPGVLVSPTRYTRMVVRSLCAPASNAGTNAIPGKFWDINADAPAVFVKGAPAAQGVNVKCLERAQAANGLYTGQYFAPVGEYIFPENVVAGDRLVPFNFWSLNFLASGEGGSGPLNPQPW